MTRLAMYLISSLLMMSCKNDELKIPEPVNNQQEVTVTPLAAVPPLEERVIYEVNLRAFSSAGTFDGVTQRLDEIASLGVNVIWLMPIHPIGQVNGIGSPYSVRDYGTVSSEYGTLDDFKNLVNEAHQRDMAVIMDWVANHTAWDHDWISSHKDWYTQDANGNIVEPPNTGWADVAELNFNNGAMRQEMINEMIYWIDQVGVDGFRADAIDMMPASFWAQAIPAVNAATSRTLIWLGEGGEPANISAGFEMNYAWDFYYQGLKGVFEDGKSAATLFSISSNEYTAINQAGEKLRYISNHDVSAWEESVVDVFELWGSVAAFVVTSYLKGVPLIYTGQEVGYPHMLPFFTKSPIDWSANASVFEAYQQIMAVRAALPPVHGGELKTYSDTDVAVFKRIAGDQEVLVIVNVRNTNQTLTLPAELQNTDWQDELSQRDLSLATTLELGAFEYKILSKGI